MIIACLLSNIAVAGVLAAFFQAKPAIPPWTWPPLIILPLIIAALVYTVGVARMWHRKSHAGMNRTTIGFFVSGWLSLLIALDSPIHELGEQLFSVHMIQHEILMLVSAPLLLLGKPWLVAVWALPQRLRTSITSSAQTASQIWRFVTLPVLAWVLHGLALWLWHAPAFFELSLRSDAMHALQHISFLVSALIFWWVLVDAPGHRLSDGAAIVYVFTTAIHTSFLGALLTFAPRVWYRSYLFTALSWGLTGLEDQQLGGLIMWIPAGTLLLGVTLFLLVRWMKRSDRRWTSERAAIALPQVSGDQP